MRILPAGMQAHLDSGAASLCYCWKLSLVTGAVSGFTSHDRDLNFDGVTYSALSGFEASAIEISLGLNVDDLEAIGALSAATLNEADLAAGMFDNAQIQILRVNWQNVSQRVILASGNLGEVTRGAVGFRAEMRGLAHHLNQPLGRLYQYGCDTDVGSSRCAVDLTAAAFKGTGSVQSVPVLADNRRAFIANGLSGFTSEWFSRGKIRWTNGANAGLAMEVKEHVLADGVVAVALWLGMPHLIAAGDTFTITAGCDKQFATCRSKFSNAVNFRGFHLMPGNDWIQSYPRPGDSNDGMQL
ncbi:MAG: DUF2163 domain-containing protein [Alphaproteobacteria bacterium]